MVGVWFRLSPEYDQFVQHLRAFKQALFDVDPDECFCLHRKEIMNAQGGFWRLRDPAFRETFDRGLLAVKAAADFRLCCVAVDKPAHGSKLYRSLRHPYHYGLAALLERYVGWLNRNSACGDVMAEARGGKPDSELQEAFGETLRCGTRYRTATEFQKALTSSKIKLKTKQHSIPGLELADLLASSCTRATVGAPLKGYGQELLAAIESKWNRHDYDGRVKGFGRVVLS